MIRVAQVMEATTGGMRRHLRLLTQHLNRERFAVEVIVSTRRDLRFLKDVEWMRAQGLPVHILPMVREIRPAADLRALLQLGRLLRRGRYDIVHTHSAKAGFLGRLAARWAGVPVVLYTPHAFPFMMSSGRGFYAWLERRVAPYTTRFIAVSEGERAAGLAAGVGRPEQYVVIENGIDLAALRAAEPRMDRRSQWGLSAEDVVIGTVGRLVGQKGVCYLIAAVPQVLAAVPQAHFVIVGSGELEERLRRQAQQAGVAHRVHLVGWQEEVVSCYEAFDVFVLPSLWEGCPYTLLEAMGCERAVVATRVAGCSDIVREGETGLLVPPAQPEALAEALITLGQDPSRRREMGKRGREWVERRYSLERFITKLETLYEELYRDSSGAAGILGRLPSAGAAPSPPPGG
jgi:glycosyltransferase involved in cell wall biosynthesis